jgi:hypothetical protein
MDCHPSIRGMHHSLIGIWAAGGEIGGIVDPEHHTGTVYSQVGAEGRAVHFEESHR